MEAQLTDPRVQRGVALAKAMGAAIKLIDGTRFMFVVPSATHPGTNYVVDAQRRSCSCPDFAEFGAVPGHRCKHVVSVLIVTHEITLPDGGSIAVQQKITIQYPRDWRAVNKYLVDLPRIGPLLIRDLVSGIPRPAVFVDGILCPAEPRGPGRPRVEIRDVVHAAILRTFERRTIRGTVEVMERSRDRGLGLDPMHYNTLAEHAADPRLMPILQDLMGATAKVLVPIERNFAIDSTGFTTCVYESWNRAKHGYKPPANPEDRGPKAPKRKHRWLKCNACIGTSTHGITAVVITDSRVHDTKMFAELVHRTVSHGFVPEKFTADAAYINTANIEVVEGVGAAPYIMFKKNMNGKSSPALTRLMAKLTSDPEDYMREYHNRSNVETSFGIMKQQFGGNVNARKPAGQYNELMCKVICHNIARIVHAIHELSISPKFWSPAPMNVPLLGTDGATVQVLS